MRSGAHGVCVCLSLLRGTYYKTVRGKDSEKEDSEARKMERSFVFVFFFFKNTSGWEKLSGDSSFALNSNQQLSNKDEIGHNIEY